MGDYGHDLQFGTFITPGSADPQHTVDLAVLTERVGLDLVTFQDHPYQPAFLDTWTLMSYMAARTERVHIAANVINLPLRPPGVLARAAASLDLLSGGRFDLALGAGAFWDAIEAMGGRRLEPGEAVTALVESIKVIRTLWDTSVKGGVRIEGEHHQVVGAKRGPAPAHDIPIWLGAGKPRMLRVVGRHADGWLPSLARLGGPEQIDASNATPERLTQLALDHGFATFILPSDDPQQIERLARDVAPAVRETVASRRGSQPRPARVGRSTHSGNCTNGRSRPTRRPPRCLASTT